jgi:hypothetical protein
MGPSTSKFPSATAVSFTLFVIVQCFLLLIAAYPVALVSFAWDAQHASLIAALLPGQLPPCHHFIFSSFSLCYQLSKCEQDNSRESLYLGTCPQS